MISLLNTVHLFSELSETDLLLISNICKEVEIPAGETIAKQATSGDAIYIISKGTIEVMVESKGESRNVVELGEGQVFGEMTLVDKGHRSATGQAGHAGCTTYKIEHTDLIQLFGEYNRIGYIVMRKLAMDLAFKIRRMNLSMV